MYSWEYQEAIFASDLTYKAKLVGLAISYYYNWKEASPSFPSISTLQQRTGLSKASIHRAKSELVSQGYLSETRQFNSSNLYLPQIPPKSHTETGVVSEGRTNYEVNYEYNNDDETDLSDPSHSVIINNNTEEETKEKEDDPATWTEDRRRQWFLTEYQGGNTKPREYIRTSTRDHRYIQAVPEFIKDMADAGKDQW